MKNETRKKINEYRATLTVGFTGNAATIANVHQHGLSARPTKNANYKVQYAQRELLGFSKEDLNLIEMLVLEQLAR